MFRRIKLKDVLNGYRGWTAFAGFFVGLIDDYLVLSWSFNSSCYKSKAYNLAVTIKDVKNIAMYIRY